MLVILSILIIVIGSLVIFNIIKINNQNIINIMDQNYNLLSPREFINSSGYKPGYKPGYDSRIKINELLKNIITIHSVS